ncbi:MAG TPA: High molecular weight rubredoxin [Dehalococcoidia bacterium]|nr:High molecular weight rubredoxin [Dehalococcoidia bacterium]
MNTKAFYSISYGLYIISSKLDAKINAQIANTVFQVCSEPPIIAVALNRKNYTHEFITRSGVFAVSILSQDTPLSFIGDFGFKSGRDTDKFKNVNYRVGQTGAPIVLDNALAFIEAKVINHLDVVTHTIFVGGVVECDVLKDGSPLTYAYYQQVKRGTTPKTAPSYIESKKEVATGMPKYICTICGYIYDPEKGDPDSGIAQGTPFEKLPADWVCPVCGATKDQFEKQN